MKVLLVLLVFLLNGCYLANGSPSESKYWLRNGKTISIEDNKKCSENIYPNLGGGDIIIFMKKESK